MSAHPLAKPSPRRWILAVVLGITTIAGALWLRGFPLESLLEKWDPAHWSAWLSYIALVTLMQMLWFPRMSTHFLGGIIFPWPFAGLLALVGDMTSAILGFLLGRYFGATRVEARLERRPKAKGVVEVIRKGRPLSSVALARTLPVAHYTAVSYLSGSLGLPFGAYLLAAYSERSPARRSTLPQAAPCSIPISR